MAMCLLAVLGIALASYLAVARNEMKLSNRAYAKDVSFQLAQMGLERALRSFNTNSFSGWTNPDATTSTLTFTISSSDYGSSGITTAVNVRVDRYTARLWNAATAYAANDMASCGGVWFHCSAANTNHAPPNTSYWVSAPAIWSADAKYSSATKDIVLYGGNAYSCKSDNSNQPPPNTAYWKSISVGNWDSGASYKKDDVALSGGTAYRCIKANGNVSPPNLKYWVSGPVIYSQGVATLPDNAAATIETELRAEVAPAPLFPNALGATQTVNLSAGGTVDSYNSILGAYGGSNVGSSAVVAGEQPLSTSVIVNSARLNGYVAAAPSGTSPYAPLFSYGGSAIVTSLPAPAVPNPRVDLTRVSRSPFVPQFDIQTINDNPLPSSAGHGSYLFAGNQSLGTPGATAPSVYGISATYYAGSLNAGLYLYNGNNLTINGPVILNVYGPLYTYYGSITITSTGSLEIYFTGELYLGDNAGHGINNQTQDPRKLVIVGTSNYNSPGYHYFWTNLPFYGVIYMPNAFIHAWNSGYDEQIYGAISASNIYFNHTVNVHYSTALRMAGSVGSYIDQVYNITQWRELTDPAERVSLP